MMSHQNRRYRKNAPMVVASVVGVILLAVCVAIGLAFPIELPKTFWIIFVFIYIMIASANCPSLVSVATAIKEITASTHSINMEP